MRTIFVVILVLVHFLSNAQVPDPSGSLLNVQLTDFSTKSIKGDSINTLNWRGDIIVLNFWFTNCGPCIKEIGQLNKVAEKYENQNIRFVAITWEKDEEFLKKFAAIKNMKYALVASGKSIIDMFLLKLYPTNVVIDQHGVIRFIESGFYGDIEQKLTKVIEELLK